MSFEPSPSASVRPPIALPPPLTKRDRLADPYVAAGDRAYLIGAQDGSFPDVGQHVPGEMWGLWGHPHKLLDGYWCALRPAEQPAPVWLEAADACVVEAVAVSQIYEEPLPALRVTRRQWVPEGHPALVVEWLLADASGLPRSIEVTVAARSDLRPGWLQEVEDGDDLCALDAAGEVCLMDDRQGGWALAWGSTLPVAGFAAGEAAAPVRTAGRGCTAALRFAVAVPAGGVARLAVAFYGAGDAAAAARGLRGVLQALPELEEAKRALYGEVVHRTRLDVPDELLGRAWDWVKCDYRWLVRDVPGIGRGLGAGLAEYPWWFGCDTGYALRGLLPLGDFATAVDTLRLLAEASARHNGGSGRIIHELAGSGAVYNPGNTQETPQFTCAVWETYLWTGDEALLRDLYPLCRRGVLQWTLGDRDADGDLLPDGYGIIEVAGLDAELIDSAAWTAAALEALGQMAERVGDAETAARCGALAPRAREAVHTRFWLPEQGIYADVVATPRRLLARLALMEGQAGHHDRTMAAYLQELAARARSLPPDEEVAWYAGNWVALAPLELGLAPAEAAARAFRLLEGPSFSGPYGVYLSAISRRAAMTISTGALAAAEVAYGRLAQAVGYARQIAGSLELHMPGGISEMSPDGGCFVQAWSGYGVVYPITAGVLGLAPDAGRRRLVLAPHLPPDWDHAALRDLRVGSTTVDVQVARTHDGLTCSVAVAEPGWEVSVAPPPGQRVAVCTVDGTPRGVLPVGPAVARPERTLSVVLLPAV